MAESEKALTSGFSALFSWFVGKAVCHSRLDPEQLLMDQFELCLEQKYNKVAETVCRLQTTVVAAVWRWTLDKLV